MRMSTGGTNQSVDSALLDQAAKRHAEADGLTRQAAESLDWRAADGLRVRAAATRALANVLDGMARRRS